MRCFCALLLPAVVVAWPWPWDNKTTTPAPSAVSAFEQGVAAAFGFGDVSSCYKQTRSGVSDLWDAEQDYKRGGYVKKAEAVAKFGEGVKSIIAALEPCSSSMTSAAKFKKLVADLRKPQYYTVHNALTLLLNVAEDRQQLEAFSKSWEQGDFYNAGLEIGSTLMDVLDNPGIPSNNGTEAIQIAYGLAKGFTSDINFTCFADLSVEVPALVGGVIDIATAVKAVTGLESVFHGLEGLVPCYYACLSDKPRIMYLLHTVEDFKHPAELATEMFKNVKANGVDLSLETASAILAYKGGEWDRFGLMVGKMLGKVIILAPNTTAATIVV